MKEAVVNADLSVSFVSREPATPKPGQVLIKVEVASTNPKDWKLPHSTGDDLAGTVARVGEGVVEFHVGDRVAAFHEMGKPDGAFSEYAIAPAAATFHIPGKTSFEEAATIPAAAMTAAMGLYKDLRLPEPWHLTTTSTTPLVVYGGATAVGAFAIKLAQASNIHPIIAVAGRGSAYVETLIDRSKGDTIVDYRNGDEAVVAGITAALPQQGKGTPELIYAFDAVSEMGSTENIARVPHAPGSKVAVVLPGVDESSLPATLQVSKVLVLAAYTDYDPAWGFGAAGVKTGGPEFGFAFFRLFYKALSDGWLSGHPYTVVPGGLAGVQQGLKDLKEGKASATKYVYRIADTPAQL